MSSTGGDTRSRLLAAAADLIAAAPGEEFSLRAVCDRVGVKLPTLYHFFGSKEGLLEAITEHGFDLYLATKEAHEATGDPIADLRVGWDLHVAFGLAHPGFYALMYGKVRPGHSSPAQDRPSEVLRTITRAAADQGRLVVDPDQAAAHVLVANIGVTLRLIVRAEDDRTLSLAVREATIAAITGTSGGTSRTSLEQASHQLMEHLARHPEIIGPAESQLMGVWLSRLAAQAD